MAIAFAKSFEAVGKGFSLYNFPAVGDVIPMHSHTFDHISILSKGSVAITDGELKNLVVSAPQVVMFRAGIKHEVVALEAGTVLLNVF